MVNNKYNSLGRNLWKYDSKGKSIAYLGTNASLLAEKGFHPHADYC